MGDRRIILEHAPGREDILVIRLNRPEKLNALDLDMWKKLGVLVGSACSSDARGVILTGTGRAFSAGDDINAMLALDTLDEARRFFRTLAGTMEAIALCPKPVAAAVNGIAAGGGAEMLLLVDYVTAVPEAMIGYPETSLGLIPPLLATVGTVTLGLKTARRLALAGAWLTAEEARKLGIVDEITSDPLGAAVKTVEGFHATPGQSLASVKRLQYEALRAMLDRAVEELARLVVTDEARARMGSFLESRGGRRQ
ncbi:MAG: enoyl-CoA hydratase/isomerase family protein [Desulfurococcales archaeon]|nr:enoyl-CoA hydratase/isomerase family protein [Desulfurococcales archaeon]